MKGREVPESEVPMEAVVVAAVCVVAYCVVQAVAPAVGVERVEVAA